MVVEKIDNKLDFFEYKYNNKEEQSHPLTKARKKVNNMENGKEINDLITSVTSAMMEGRPVVTEMCNTIGKWCISSSNQEKGDNMNIEAPMNELIKSMCKFEDYITSVVFDEGNTKNIWIVIEEECFSNNRKYIRNIREYNCIEQNEAIQYIIFDKEDKGKVYEHLNTYKLKYKEFKKYA